MKRNQDHFIDMQMNWLSILIQAQKTTEQGSQHEQKIELILKEAKCYFQDRRRTL